MSGAEDRKYRHSIMRKLQRADWATQESDAADALNAVVAASRLYLKMDDAPEGLSGVIGRAMVVVLEESDYGAGETFSDVLKAAGPLLILEDEDFRGCDYGM